MLAERFDAFFLDLDGVVYLGDEPLPGAREALARLRRAGKEIRFLTNHPRPTRTQVCRRLNAMGVEAHTEEVVTSGWATASYLLQNGIVSAYVVGSRGLASEIGGVGVEVVDGGPCDAVVLGSDEYVSYGHIRQASRCIFDGARFIATNADATFPAPKGPVPGTGAIVEAVRVVTGKRPVVIGKPSPPMFDMALKDLNVGRERVVMIGDTPASDIAGAHRAGIAGVLVSRKEDASARGSRAADAVILDLSALFDPKVTADLFTQDKLSEDLAETHDERPTGGIVE
jgi:HAD superfamily hydrolase (TIGR01450 family)